MKPHAFIAMPFGRKVGHDGTLIDFDAVHRLLLQPALEAAGCTPMRADEEQAAGSILADMFQELLVADLVLADLTLDNPNVWYELGVRHALRARGVVLVQGPRPNSPFDVYTERKLRYHLKDGQPDPDWIERDREDIAEMVRATLASGTRRIVSPVYQLLPHLQQPQWRDLLLGQDNEFSQSYRAWRERVDIAVGKGRPGDIVMLASETPTRALRMEGQREAGAALLKLGHAAFALEQLDAALEVEPEHLPTRCQRAICLARLDREAEAEAASAALLEEHPGHAEVLALAGSLARQRWQRRWQAVQPDGAPAAQEDRARLRAAAAEEDALLAEACEHFRQAFAVDPHRIDAGVDALTLAMLRQHLEGEIDAAELTLLQGGVRWGCDSALARGDDFRPLAGLAASSLLTDPLPQIRRRLKAALAVARSDWFAIDSMRRTVQLLADLGFRAVESASALALLQAEAAQLRAPVRPRKVVLFSGHRIDTPGRQEPRFPPTMEAAARQAIESELEELQLGSLDLALCQGAAGGDLLFLEACQRRGMHVQLLSPFDEASFIERSVRPSLDGEAWCQRYFDMRARLRTPPRHMPEELGPGPSTLSPYERCNLWLLYTALAWGMDRLHFICLWNGGGGDGPGGTAHMLAEVKRRTGRVSWIDTRTL